MSYATQSLVFTVWGLAFGALMGQFWRQLWR
jgi:hypothetical protein